MRRTYVGSTLYHIYLSILHCVRDSGYEASNLGENLLFLVESTPQIETLVPYLKKRFFRDVHLLSERRQHVNALGKFNYGLRRRKKLVPYLEKLHPCLVLEKAFINDSQLYLCDSDSSKSYFLYAYGGRPIAMIEDGARTYHKRHTASEEFYKTWLTGTPIGGGFDKQIETIYAQFPDRLPKEIRSKAKELNIKKETAKLDEVLKTEIFQIFIQDTTFQIDGEHLALVLTQPLSEDRVVLDETVKVGIYRDLISKIPTHMKVVLKVHPRETTRYQDHFPDIAVLPGLFPIEILNLRKGFYFEHGYTLFSTALTNLEIVRKRFFSGKDYLDKFTVKATRDLIKHMNVEQQHP